MYNFWLITSSKNEVNRSLVSPVPILYFCPILNIFPINFFSPSVLTLYSVSTFTYYNRMTPSSLPPPGNLTVFIPLSDVRNFSYTSETSFVNMRIFFVTSINQIRTDRVVLQPQELEVSTATVRKNGTLFQFLVTHLPYVQYSFNLILIPSQWISCLFHLVYFCTIYIQNCTFQALNALLFSPLHISASQIPLPSPTSQ